MNRRIHQLLEKRTSTPSRDRQAAVLPRVIDKPYRSLTVAARFSTRYPSRSGSLLLELMVAGALLGVVTASVIPTLGWLVRQRKFNQERQAAVLEVGNLMERLTALDWNELTSERAAQFHLSDPMEQQLSEPRLTVSVDIEDDAAKRVLIQLAWQIGPSRAAPPVRLAAWVYRQGTKSVVSSQ
jgi:type II secretory pathway pseudopilin PulG